MKKVTPDKKEPTVDEHEEDTTAAPESSRSAEPSSPRDLNSLREILFGHAAREYNARFRTVDKELERLHQSSEQRYTDLDTKLDQKFEELHSDIHKRLQEIDKQLNEQIDQVTDKGEVDLRKLSTLVDNLAQELHEKIDKVSTTQTNLVSELRDQMRRNYDTLRNEIVSETDDLDDRKLSRFNLADSLIELAMKLKGENILDEIGTQLAEEM
ncbi:MAG: hypothetical protein O7E52_05915 [Candidatus Poribacteria bacterium]|nr:hypothetical protein [Candidatus Poribacteria bacterium]